MSYIIVFIISLLLNPFPITETDQTKVKVTFESASLVHNSMDKNLWSYSAAVNNLDIGEDEIVELSANSLDKVTFMVTANKLSNSTEEGESTVNALVIDDLKVEHPAALNTYGSNPVTINLNELLAKKPGLINIHVDVKENNGNSLVGKSTKVIFKFKLEYE